LRVASADAIPFSEEAVTSIATTFPARSTLQVVLEPIRAEDAGGMAVEQVSSSLTGGIYDQPGNSATPTETPFSRFRRLTEYEQISSTLTR
jgi:hypothetical protein